GSHGKRAPGPPPAPAAPAGRAASRWPRRPPGPPPRSRRTGQHPSLPPSARLPYAAVWKLHTVPYSYGGAEGKRPPAAHPRRLDHRRPGRDRGRRPGRGERRTARRPPGRYQGQLLLALREPGRAARRRDPALGTGDDDPRGPGG